MVSGEVDSAFDFLPMPKGRGFFPCPALTSGIGQGYTEDAMNTALQWGKP
jgi:hypothetical protein